VPGGHQPFECLAGFGRRVVAHLVVEDVHDRLVEDGIRGWPKLMAMLAATYSSCVWPW
jgi:hypothetical protein